jgi:hypothetical protein
MSTVAQISANQANAQHSTGPLTEEGKARSARNNFRHGLASGQLIVPGEDPADFEALAQDLFNEHQPATTTEENLVLAMAQHFWLGQRAIRLQNEAFVDGGGVAQLSLLLRYQTSNQRAYTRCLADLFKLRTERHRDEDARFREPKTSINGFESQKSSELGNQPPRPRKPYYIRNPKYAHMLLIDVPEAERFIKIDPNAPEAQTETPVIAANGFESQSNSQVLQNSESRQNEAAGLSEPKMSIKEAARLSEPNVPITGFESQIDPRAEKLIRQLHEIRLRLDQEEAAA